MGKRKRQGGAFALPLLLLLGSLAGCGGEPQEDASGAGGSTNTYTLPVNEDGYIVVEIPVTLMGGNSAEDVIAEFQNSAQYDHEGEVAPMEHVTDITANADGSVNYIRDIDGGSEPSADLLQRNSLCAAAFGRPLSEPFQERQGLPDRTNGRGHRGGGYGAAGAGYGGIS